MRKFSGKNKLFVGLAIFSLVGVFLLTQGCGGCGRFGRAMRAGREMAKTAKEFEKEYKKTANLRPVKPVNWRELIKFIPASVPGFEASEPSGETITMSEEITYSSAKGSYSSDDKNVDITIFDPGYRQIFFALGFAWFIQAEYDSSDGYLKDLKVKGMPAKVNWKYKEKSGTVIVKVGDRFLVNIEGDNLAGDKELIKIAELIDYAGISRLK